MKNKLRKLRTKQGLSMRGLADKVNEESKECNITHAVIFSIENKDTSPHLTNADGIALALGVTVGDIWRMRSEVKANDK